MGGRVSTSQYIDSFIYQMYQSRTRIEENRKENI